MKIFAKRQIHLLGTVIIQIKMSLFIHKNMNKI